jgi:CheY-like chemotaxis protein
VLFRQQFRHDLRAGRFTMEFAQSGPVALQRITNVGAASLILILSDINTPGMSGLSSRLSSDPKARMIPLRTVRRPHSNKATPPISARQLPP